MFFVQLALPPQQCLDHRRPRKYIFVQLLLRAFCNCFPQMNRVRCPKDKLALGLNCPLFGGKQLDPTLLSPTVLGLTFWGLTVQGPTVRGLICT